MKAIYLNLDDALRAVLAGQKPAQPQVPLAVTIPAGASAAVFAQTGTAAKTTDAGSAVTGITWTFSPSLGDAIASGVAPGMSQVLASESASVYAVTGGAFVATAAIKNSDTTLATVAITVIVNREQASGPVDVVDFTPPATLTAAQINTALGGTGAAEGQPLKGVSLSNATNAPAPSAADIKSALVAAGDTALDGVSLAKALVVAGTASDTTTDSVTLVRMPNSDIKVLGVKESPESFNSGILGADPGVGS